MVLGELPVSGRLTNLDESRTRAYCACSGCGWELFGHLFSHLSFLFSFSLSLGDGPIKTEILCQRAVKPKKQPTSCTLPQALFSIPYGIENSCQKTSYSLKIL